MPHWYLVKRPVDAGVFGQRPAPLIRFRIFGSPLSINAANSSAVAYVSSNRAAERVRDVVVSAGHLGQQKDLRQHLGRHVEDGAPVRLFHHQDDVGFLQQRRRQGLRTVCGKVDAAAAENCGRVRARAAARLGPDAGRENLDFGLEPGLSRCGRASTRRPSASGRCWRCRRRGWSSRSAPTNAPGGRPASASCAHQWLRGSTGGNVGAGLVPAPVQCGDQASSGWISPYSPLRRR